MLVYRWCLVARYCEEEKQINIYECSEDEALKKKNK